MTPSNFLDFIHLLEALKNNTRHSYTSQARLESVSEHSHRLCAMAFLLKYELPEIDMDKVVKMCIIHDFGEALTGDIPIFNKSNIDEQKEKAAIYSLIAPLDKNMRDELCLLFEEMAQLKTPESKVLKALDKLEALIQHNEAGIGTWIDIEYHLNLTYGTEECNAFPYLKEIRDILREQAKSKINNNM